MVSAQLQQAENANPGIVADITAVAKQMGVDPQLALATAYHESGFNPQSVGDQGTSFGLFQLHRGGELGSLTPQQAFDPITNARVALSQFASVQKQTGTSNDPGFIAASAQRPADPGAYNKAIDQLLGNQYGTAYASNPSLTSPSAAGAVTGLGAVSVPWSQVPQSAAAAFLSSIFGSGALMRGFLVMVGVIILFIGLSRITHDEDGPGQTVASGTQTVKVRLQKAVKSDAPEAAAE